MGNWLIAIMAVGIVLAAIAELVQRRRERKRQEAEAREAQELSERYAMDAAKREALWQEKLIARRAKETKYPSTAPTARATVLKMRKDEQSSSEAIADAMIRQVMYTNTGYLDGDPAPTASTHGLMRGQGGTFDGGGSSGDWSGSSSGSSSSSSDSSSSPSDSGSSSSGSD